MGYKADQTLARVCSMREHGYTYTRVLACSQCIPTPTHTPPNTLVYLLPQRCLHTSCIGGLLVTWVRLAVENEWPKYSLVNQTPPVRRPFCARCATRPLLAQRAQNGRRTGGIWFTRLAEICFRPKYDPSLYHMTSRALSWLGAVWEKRAANTRLSEPPLELGQSGTDPNRSTLS